MKTVGLLMVAALVLAGCGGGSKVSRSVPLQTQFATGPIFKACMRSDRKARSRSLCGCIQVSANRSLSDSQQARAVKFYNNPQLAQDTKRSDKRSDERFWEAYETYARRAKANCA